MGTDRKKRFKRAMGRVAYYFFTALFAILPYRVIKAISNFLIVIAIGILKRLRKTAMETLRLAFGKEKTEEELQKICRDCFIYGGKSAIEIVALNTRPKLLLSKFTFEGDSQKNLEAALAEGNGTLAVSAHFGNFPLMLLWLAQKGYPTNAIIRPSRDEEIEKHFTKARIRLGLKTIHSYPREACVRQSIKCLRQKELLIVLLDQNTGSKAGVFVDFFGRKAGTSTGPIIFALRTGSPIVPMFTRRIKDDHHALIVEPHFYLEKKETDEETIQAGVQKITNIIEKYIRMYPEQWAWMHNRFKSKPKDDE